MTEASPCDLSGRRFVVGVSPTLKRDPSVAGKRKRSRSARPPASRVRPRCSPKPPTRLGGRLPAATPTGRSTGRTDRHARVRSPTTCCNRPIVQHQDVLEPCSGNVDRGCAVGAQLHLHGNGHGTYGAAPCISTPRRGEWQGMPQRAGVEHCEWGKHLPARVPHPTCLARRAALVIEAESEPLQHGHILQPDLVALVDGETELAVAILSRHAPYLCTTSSFPRLCTHSSLGPPAEARSLTDEGRAGGIVVRGCGKCPLIPIGPRRVRAQHPTA